MSDTARDYQTIEAASTEGLDSLFEQAQVTYAQAPVAGFEQPVTCAADQESGVPVELAAKLLGTSTNALKKRLRKGTITGYKLETKHGDKWFVAQGALPQPAPILDDLAPVPIIETAPMPVDEAPVTCSVAPVTCAIEPVPTYADSPELFDRIRELEAKLEGATYRNGYLEAENEGLRTLLGAKDTHIKLLTDSQHKSAWWARFSRWFLGTK